MNVKKIKKFLRAKNPKPKTVARKIKNMSRAIYRRLEQDLFRVPSESKGFLGLSHLLK